MSTKEQGKKMKPHYLFKENKAKQMVIAMICNIVLAYALLFAARLIFVMTNYTMYADTMEYNQMWLMAKGALLFDTSAVCYLNTLYLLCLLFPLHIKEGKAMQAITKWAYIIPNATGIIANLCDCVYIPFTGRRTTWNVFSEFGNESNLGAVIGTEIINHWWLVLTGLLLMWLTFTSVTFARYSCVKCFSHLTSLIL